VARYYRAIIFDLGNVVINFSFDNIFNHWADVTGVSAYELKRRFVYDEMFCRFERGEIDSSCFRKYVLKKLGIEMSDAEFDEGWNAIYLDIVPGIEYILRDLRRHFRLIALTNTNELHAQRWKMMYASVLRHFEKVFCSHEMKVRKPEQRAFEIVLSYLELNPHEVLFLDDNPEFVRAASGMHITGILVTSLEQMICELNKCGVYSP